MNNKESIALIKQEFENNLKEGLLNLQVKWLIEQAEKLDRIENEWRHGTDEGIAEELEKAFNG